MQERFLIGELAKIFNISTDTLRHYDKLNLLKPEKDPINKYRYYSVDSMFKLSRILFLKNLGISLKEISEYINNKDAEHLIDLLRRKDQDLDEMIQHLLNLKHRINRNIELYDHAKTQLGKITISTIEARQAILLDTRQAGGGEETDSHFRTEENLAKMKSRLSEGLIFTSVSKSDMEKQIYDRFQYFIEIESPGHDIHVQFAALPKGKYACMTVIGPYEDHVHHYKKMIDWIQSNGYAIAGDSVENNILDRGDRDLGSEFITEIQIPIRKIKD